MAPDSLTQPVPSHAPARQRLEFRTGDEAAAIAARAAGFDPLVATAATPASEVATYYGASLGGARVIGRIGTAGLMAGLQQLSLQSAARVPMVLNVSLRAVAGPADIGCDHSALYQALDTGCIVLCARDPQAVYDLNLAAVRIGEHPQVRLPVIVAYDGHATSDEKRRVLVLDDPEALAAFLGTRAPTATPLDTAHPATFGAVTESGFLDNKRQLSQAMDAASAVIPEVFAELATFTGRTHAVLDAHAMDDAEAAAVLLNSAAEAAKEAVDVWREQGRKVGVLSPNVLRPFPADEFRAWLRHAAAVVVADRADSYGAHGGRLSAELRAALQQDEENTTRVLSRIYGLGGSAFRATDAERLLDEAFAVATTGEEREPFAYSVAPDAAPAAPSCVTPDAAPAATVRGPIHALPPIRSEDVSRGMAKVRRNESTGRLEVELEPLWKMTAIPGRIAPGHAACPGCGALSTLHQLYKVLEGDLVVLFQSGCAITVTTERSATAHRVSCIHDPAPAGAATLAGLIEAYRERVRRGELPAAKEPTFVMVVGDGAMQAGLGAAIDVAHRNPRMLVLEYDNQGRMSTGAQASRSTPLDARPGDNAQILAACHVPYVFTASEGFPEDLLRKAAKAQWYARNEGMAYGRILSFCPLNWKTADDAAEPALQAAIDSCFFPLYEIERGHTLITYDPDAIGRRKPVVEWLQLMGRSAHLADAANAALADAMQAETDRRWARLKARHEHPLL